MYILFIIIIGETKAYHHRPYGRFPKKRERIVGEEDEVVVVVVVVVLDVRERPSFRLFIFERDNLLVGRI